ncbi:MAG: glycosyltransferase [Armatimonadota bacterium]|nr:glycosyltransferase [Armatimonadota bacterium]
MKVVCVTEKRYYRTPDGSVWTSTGRSYSYWSIYLKAFDQVKVVARVLNVEAREDSWLRADGESVCFHPVPHYLGPKQLLLSFGKVRRAATSAIELGDAVVLYAGGPMSGLVAPYLWRLGYPYGVYVGGDPYDTFAPRAFRHPLRPILRWHFTRQLKKQCLRACAAQYVTQYALQRRYPCPGLTISASGVELPDTALAERPRQYDNTKRPVRIVTIGTFDVMYKAPDVLIEAVSTCVRDGLDLELTFIGDGVHRKAMETLAAARNIGDRTRFLGRLPSGQAVFAELDKADLFVLPSYCEGLPRAMIEAMARGLPCIGTNVGGVPELLPSEDIVAPGSVPALAHKIAEVVSSPERMTAMSARNLERARDFTDSVIGERRLQFYTHLRDKTQEWIAGVRSEPRIYGA